MTVTVAVLAAVVLFLAAVALKAPFPVPLVLSSANQELSDLAVHVQPPLAATVTVYDAPSGDTPVCVAGFRET